MAAGAEGRGSAVAATAGLVLLLSSLLLPSAAYTIYKVGGDAGWTNQVANGIGFTAWAANQSFLVGDMLVFSYEDSHTVVQTNNVATYDSCNADAKDAQILSSSGSTESNVMLRAEGTTYFFCSALAGEHCRNGMKFAINVGPSKTGGALSPNEAPSPFSSVPTSPGSNASPSTATGTTPAADPNSSTKSEATTTRLCISIVVFPLLGLLFL